MKVLITGAHFTPAQAVIEELKKRPEIEIIYIGRKYTQEGDKNLSVESQVLPTLDVKFLPLTTGRLQRRFTLYTIPSLLKIPIGFFQAFYYLVKIHPDVVLSFGGYVAVPVVFAAWLLNIPIIVHEQTLVSGLSNRISNIFASKIAVSFDQKYSFDRSKTVLTGNPIRKEILEPKELTGDLKDLFLRAKKETKPVILITGGNQGSHIINKAVEGSLDELLKLGFIIHQTGDSKFGDFERLEKKNSSKYLVFNWIKAEDMGGVLKRADMVISRAGANILLELSYFGIPTLMIPIPFIYKDEQSVNAKFFESQGLGKILPQRDLSSNSLAKALKEVVLNLDQLKVNAKRAENVMIKDASKRLAQEVLVIANKD